MPTIDTTDAKVFYRVDGSGPGLVLVHGTGGNSETNWAQMVPALARHWTVVRPDYSGSGRTVDGGGALSVEILAAQVVAAARAAGAAPFDLVGFSLGAAIAAVIAASHPDLVRRVVLLGAFAASDDPRQMMQFDLWRDLIRRDRRAMARFLLLTGFSPDFLSGMGDDAVETAIDLLVRDSDWDGMARQIDLDLAIDVRAHARRIGKPTLVVGGTLDHMVPPAQAREVAGLIPGAHYAEMATGHLGLLERPGMVAALIRDFLRDAALPPASR
jgi:Predicted hydrolases or acyltransferases (alpha/beta hydrolase superfamily)